MSTEEEKKNFNSIISDATIIALISAALYICAYSYEAAYLSHFNIPLHLAQIKADTLLTIILPSFTVIAFILMVANLISVHWPETPEIKFKLEGIILALLFPLWNLYLYGWRTSDITFYIIIFALLIFPELIWPLIAYKHKKTLKEKMIADVRAEQGFYRKNIGTKITLLFGTPIYMVFFTSVIGVMLSHNAGIAKSITQDEFFTLNNEPNVVIVRVYSDLLIGVGFDKNKMTLNDTIFLKKLDGDNAVNLTLEKIGQIKKDIKKP